MNSLILRRTERLQEEWAIYNKTLAFIEDLPPKLANNKITVLIGHVPLKTLQTKLASQVRPTKNVLRRAALCHKSLTLILEGRFVRQFCFLLQLLNAVQPRYAFSGDIHKVGQVMQSKNPDYMRGINKCHWSLIISIFSVDGVADWRIPFYRLLNWIFLSCNGLVSHASVIGVVTQRTTPKKSVDLWPK